MLILLPIFGIWAVYDILSDSRLQEYEFIIERMKDNPEEFKVTKKKIVPVKTTTKEVNNVVVNKESVEAIKLDTYN